MDNHPPDRDHLSAPQLAAYVGRSLSTEDREIAVDHLAVCAQCRDEALASARVLRSERARRAKRVGAPAAAAAALAVVVLVFGPRALTESTEPILREGDSGAASVSSIRVHSPTDSAEVGQIEFSWQDMGSEVRYRFSLTHSDGAEVWSGATADTSLTLPPDMMLSEGTTYFWWVDALLLNGRSVTTDIQRLTIVF